MHTKQLQGRPDLEKPPGELRSATLARAVGTRAALPDLNRTGGLLTLKYGAPFCPFAFHPVHSPRTAGRPASLVSEDLELDRGSSGQYGSRGSPWPHSLRILAELEAE